MLTDPTARAITKLLLVLPPLWVLFHLLFSFSPGEDVVDLGWIQVTDGATLTVEEGNVRVAHRDGQAGVFVQGSHAAWYIERGMLALFWVWSLMLVLGSRRAPGSPGREA